MLFKQSSIWKNVLESGSYPHFSSSQKGCWEGIRNPNRNSCKTVRVGCRQRFGSVAGAVCHCPVQPSVLLSPVQDRDGRSSSQEVLPVLKLSQWHKVWSLNPFSASGCLGALLRVADKRRRGLHLVKLDFCCGTECYKYLLYFLLD